MNVQRILSQRQPWEYMRIHTGFCFFQGTMEGFVNEVMPY